MYRDDQAARAARAAALIDEIAALEREKLAHATTEQRLDQAKQQLAALQAPAGPAPERRPGLWAHLAVFGATAGAAYLGYTLLL